MEPVLLTREEEEVVRSVNTEAALKQEGGNPLTVSSPLLLLL